MSYTYLLSAILFEVAGSLLLRLSDGFTRVWTGALAVLLFVLSLALLAAAMKSIPISISYPLWAGLGTVGALFGGRFLFAEHITVWQVVGVGVVLLGALIIRLSQGGYE